MQSTSLPESFKLNLCSYQIPAGDVTRFALDADLPSTADGTIQRKVLTISASRGGTRLLCAVLPRDWFAVLLAKQPLTKT